MSNLSIVERYIPRENIPLISPAAFGERRKRNTLIKYINSAARMLKTGCENSLYYFMRNSQPKKFHKPTHIMKIAAKLDAVIEDPTKNKVEICLSMPPQQGKTELIKHFIAMYCLKNPTKIVIRRIRHEIC